MRNYDRTLWENNKTLVDADKLNNVEDQILTLTSTAIRNNDRLQVIEDTLPMKASSEHTHQDLHNNIDALSLEVERINDRISQDNTSSNIENLDNKLTQQVTNLDNRLSQEITELGLEVYEELEELNQNFENLRTELREEFKKYFDDVILDNTTLRFYSNRKLIKSIELPAIASTEARAICGEVICGEVFTNQGLDSSKSKSRSYNPTEWIDGVTPINAENLNNIENKIVELVLTVEEILANGGSVNSSNIHIGNTEPVDKNTLWIDNSDEQPELQLDESIIEAFANVLKEHSNSIQELFYLSDAYLDDGEFTDTEESDYILEGGIF